MNLKKFSVMMAIVYGLSFAFSFTLIFVISNLENITNFSHAEYWIPQILIRFGISLLSGPLFGVFNYSALKKRRAFALSQVIPEATNELILDMPANPIGYPVVPGWLFLTDKALIFTATRKKQLQFTRTFLLTDITSVTPVKSKLQLTLTDGSFVQFAVNKPENWIKQIQEVASHTKQ